MNAAEVRNWCLLQYGGEFSTDEIDLFVGECLAMNADPRMRPRVVLPKRSKEDGRVYAHRLTRAMEYEADLKFAQAGITAQWSSSTIVSDPGARAALGVCDASDMVVQIQLVDTADSARYESERSRLMTEAVVQLGGKLTWDQRKELGAEIEARLGPKPDCRRVTGIGILRASAEHDETGSRSLSRYARAELLARRDALDQRFPEVFASR